ncbi:anti-phage dCTP deaminase [Leeuwenhoekiella palythoae]|uniref:anti-phage dCTP deaminase n=1 Tax=Leeuwenhoekiella palythoae TaxID=573501 RepID=UPI00351357DC
MEAKNIAHSINDNVGKTTREKVRKTLTAELFFGVCAPIGSLKLEVIERLKRIISEKYGYEVVPLKLSDYIEEFKTSDYTPKKEHTSAFSKLTYKIEEGNNIRRKYGNNSILTELAIQEIYLKRLEDNGVNDVNDLNPTNIKSFRKCYIFDSIKNREELLLLRRIYTKNFFLFSIFSPLNERKKNLLEKDLSQSEVDYIVDRDDYENNDFGQNVRGTFVDGDFFLRVSEKNLNELDEKIERYLHLIFESDIITPLIEETAMYSAKSAAGNSACLSRQVGASITNVEGDLISTGWNDVPKFGGNLYREGSILDMRCKIKEYCSNDKQKDLLVESVLKSIKDDEKLNKILRDDEGKYSIEIAERLKKNLRSSKIKDLIEFSRSVHAEMHAIISGSQLSGSKMIGGKLFCTTYPCHNCARHIIVAGIKEVYYIEPYVKSLCLTLHDDAITEDEKDDRKVKILIFDGVAPRNYLTFFTNFAERKNNGNLVKVDFKKVFPKASKSLQALPTLEQQAIHSLKECGLNDQ